MFVNAAMTQAHKIALSDIREISGLLNHATIRHQARDTERALDELVASPHPIIRSVEKQAVLEGLRLVDVIYTLHPTADFVKLVIAANRRQKDATQQIGSTPNPKFGNSAF